MFDRDHFPLISDCLSKCSHHSFRAAGELTLASVKTLWDLQNPPNSLCQGRCILWEAVKVYMGWVMVPQDQVALFDFDVCILFVCSRWSFECAAGCKMRFSRAPNIKHTLLNKYTNTFYPPDLTSFKVSYLICNYCEDIINHNRWQIKMWLLSKLSTAINLCSIQRKLHCSVTPQTPLTLLFS